jgi:hypothetical protein
MGGLGWHKSGKVGRGKLEVGGWRLGSGKLEVGKLGSREVGSWRLLNNDNLTTRSGKQLMMKFWNQ